MSASYDIKSITQLLDRLDPTASGQCGVPGCTHLDARDHDQDASPPIRMAA